MPVPPLAAHRATQIKAFHVMKILAEAKALQAQGHDVIHLQVGEPDFDSDASVIAAGRQALDEGRTHYTAAAGLPELRQAISDYYAERFNVAVDAQRIFITPGASGALQLALASLIDPGDGVLLSDPGYPCNQHYVQLLGGEVQRIPLDVVDDFQISADHINDAWMANSKVALIATPSNPTGTTISPAQLQAIADTTAQRGGALVVDELYQGLNYKEAAHTALAVSPDVFIVNSFSKYFGMTGWRLGWLVVPEAFVEVIDRLAQNLYLAAPTVAQYAALAAFEAPAMATFEQRRGEFQARRDYLIPALESLGFKIPCQPAGAFYIYADSRDLAADSYDLCQMLLHKAHVAITPGIDFGEHNAQNYCRFAYTRPIAALKEAVARIEAALKEH